MLDTLSVKPYKIYDMEFIKNHWYNCLHDCIIKESVFFF